MRRRFVRRAEEQRELLLPGRRRFLLGFDQFQIERLPLRGMSTSLISSSSRETSSRPMGCPSRRTIR